MCGKRGLGNLAHHHFFHSNGKVPYSIIAGSRGLLHGRGGFCNGFGRACQSRKLKVVANDWDLPFVAHIHKEEMGCFLDGD